jgi:hypothetical protein
MATHHTVAGLNAIDTRLPNKANLQRQVGREERAPRLKRTELAPSADGRGTRASQSREGGRRKRKIRGGGTERSTEALD